MIYVFVGPTIELEEARSLLDAVFLPPVSQGDVLRVAGSRPRAVGIIDGYFERVPAVWHKEILWAMSEGIHVLGAASMGALRAAELEPFGMIGVGEIFAAYRDGRLEDDDEVAVIHGSAEIGYRSLSEAMVDIRATVEKAVREGVIDDEDGQRLVAIAKSLYYPDRRYPTILERADQDSLRGVERLRQWLPEGRVEQKRDDAVALLERLADRSAWSQPKRVFFTFQRTEIWEHAVQARGRQPVHAVSPPELSELLLDELRLLGRASYQDRRDGALLRALALEKSQRLGVTASDDRTQRAVGGLRRRHGLRTREETESWIEDQGLDEEAFDRLMKDQSLLETVRRQHRREADRQLVAELQIAGLFGPLVDRVREKRSLVEGYEATVADLETLGLSEEELLAWHFEERLGESVPQDLEVYAADLDLAGSDVFIQLLIRERLFQRRARPKAESGEPAGSERSDSRLSVE